MIVGKPICPCLGLIVFGIVLMLATNISVCAAAIVDYPRDPYQADPREVALLPRYCIYTQTFRDRVPGGNNPVEISRWYSLLGETFHHMHHWCAGLIHANRVLILSFGNRSFNLESSIREYDYVINHAPADFVLLPEMLTRKGGNLLLLDRPIEGTAELLRAIRLKPDYWPPYAAMSDYFKKLNDVSKARDWLKKGLVASPGSQALQRRLTELDAVKVH